MMKKLLLVFFTINCFAQAPAIEWQKTYGGSNNEIANDVIQTSDGGYIVSGSTASSDGDVIGFYGTYDYWILKLNSIGEIQWQQTFGGNGDENATSIIETTNGDYIIVGWSNYNEQEVTGNHGEYDYWVVKLNSFGIIQWQKSIGGTQYDLAKSIIATSDGGFVIAGSSNSNDGDITNNISALDYWIVKIDSNGNVLWDKSYGGTESDDAFYIQQTTDGGFIITGNTNSTDGDVTNNHGDWDIWVIKLDINGNLVWQKTIGGSSYDGANTIEETFDNGFIIGGYTLSIDGDATENNAVLNSWFIKLDILGNIQWQKCLGNYGCDNRGFIHQTQNGGYIVTGSKYTNDSNDPIGIGGEDIYLGKLDNLGNTIWSKIIGTNEADFVQGVIETNDNGFVIYGNINSDLWIAKLFPEQLSTTTFQQNNITIYPNPTNNILNLKFPNDDVIENLIISDLLGKEVLNSNENSKQINVNNLSKGLYIINASSSDKKYQSKFIKQ